MLAPVDALSPSGTSPWLLHLGPVPDHQPISPARWLEISAVVQDRHVGD